MGKPLELCYQGKANINKSEMPFPIHQKGKIKTGKNKSW